MFPLHRCLFPCSVLVLSWAHQVVISEGAVGVAPMFCFLDGDCFRQVSSLVLGFGKSFVCCHKVFAIWPVVPWCVGLWLEATFLLLCPISLCFHGWASRLLVLPVPLLRLLGASRGWLIRGCPLRLFCCFLWLLCCEVAAFSL